MGCPNWTHQNLDSNVAQWGQQLQIAVHATCEANQLDLGPFEFHFGGLVLYSQKKNVWGPKFWSCFLAKRWLGGVFAHFVAPFWREGEVAARCGELSAVQLGAAVWACAAGQAKRGPRLVAVWLLQLGAFILGLVLVESAIEPGIVGRF